MGHFDHTTDISKTLKDISAALFELRDALMELSLALKDWQFATDLAQRQKSETLVQALLQRLQTMR